MTELMTLWRIGDPEHGFQQFAFGTEDADQYTFDGLWVAGLSQSERDWPYTHPGPMDPWAFNQPHTFRILFDLKQAPASADASLVIRFAHTHFAHPPTIAITLNGESIDRRLVPAGKIDSKTAENPFAAILLPVRTDEGTAHEYRVTAPRALLREGENEITITNEDGSCVLYSSVWLEAPGDTELEVPRSKTVVEDLMSTPALLERDGRRIQPVRLDIRHFGNPCDARITVGDLGSTQTRLEAGSQIAEVLIPAVSAETQAMVTIRVGDEAIFSHELTIKPVRPWTIYLLHHTHLDIGYTHTQDKVEEIQLQHLDRALELIKETNEYPDEAKFRWLPEQLCFVDTFLRVSPAEKQRKLIDAVKAGRIGLDALYGNALTGIHSNEELFALVDCAVRLREEHGVNIDSAMISDVPGLTWGTVATLAQSGVKYISSGPNPFHRVGWILKLGDRPFYWVSPCGRHRLLYWQAGGDGYAWFHGWRHPDNRRENRLTRQRIYKFVHDLAQRGYPYDVIQLRYNIDGDNGPPDPHLPDAVREWNEKHVYPKFVISTTSAMFHEFEERYGDQLPVVHGDLTPYWEDGAASTAADTAMNRDAVETLVRAETLWTMLAPDSFPDDRFRAAWREAILYDEHTWGAYNSISEPDSDFAVQQAIRKSQYAHDAIEMARGLIDEAGGSRRTTASETVEAIEVFNTLSWPRSDLIVLTAEQSRAGDRVIDADGNDVPSQRLSTGELAFIARDVPPFGSRRYSIEPGEAGPTGDAYADGTAIGTTSLRLHVDEQSGAISEIRMNGARVAGADQRESPVEWNESPRSSQRSAHAAGASETQPPATVCDGAVNEYVYVAGRDPKAQRRVESAARLSVLDAGPLIATMRIESGAPGARSLTRTIRVVDSLDRIDLTNEIDKEKIRDPEGVHFGFHFDIPGCEVRIDTPWAIVRPEKDQAVGSCKNFFCAQRFVDISNVEGGVTLATIDAPLVQIGEIRTDVERIMGPTATWLEHIEPSPAVYSYVMNNYWETNYKADQEGRATFRYSIRPYRGEYRQIKSMRFGIERRQPLVVVQISREDVAKEPPPPPLTVDGAGVIVTRLRPSRDGGAIVVRLFGASGKPEQARLRWNRPMNVYESGPHEIAEKPADEAIRLGAYEIRTLRAEPC